MQTTDIPTIRGAVTRWAESKSGNYRIALRSPEENPQTRFAARWQVWTIRTGTHDLGPHTRDFATEDEARAYANGLYRTA